MNLKTNKMKKTSKHDEYIAKVEKIAAYVNTEEKIIGIYCNNEDMLRAENNALKKLRKLFNYKIQMVIK